MLNALLSQDTKFGDTVDSIQLHRVVLLSYLSPKIQHLERIFWTKNSALICSSAKLHAAKQSWPDESQCIQFPFQSATIIATRVQHGTNHTCVLGPRSVASSAPSEARVAEIQGKQDWTDAPRQWELWSTTVTQGAPHGPAGQGVPCNVLDFGLIQPCTLGRWVSTNC